MLRMEGDNRNGGGGMAEESPATDLKIIAGVSRRRK